VKYRLMIPTGYIGAMADVCTASFVSGVSSGLPPTVTLEIVATEEVCDVMLNQSRNRTA